MAGGNTGSISPPGGGTHGPGLDTLARSDRDRILQAMTECCAEHGYGQTSVDRVIVRAGVDRSIFDLLFQGKQDCAIAALNKLASEVLTTTVTARDGSSGEFGPKLARLGAALELLAVQPSYAYLALIEARQGGTEHLQRCYEASMHLVSVVIGQAYETAAGASLPSVATRAALGGAEALVRRELAGGRAAQLPRLLPDLIYGVLVPLVGQTIALRLMRASGPAAGE